MKFPCLMLVTQMQQHDLNNYLDFIVCCIQHGVTAVQMREKNATKQEQEFFAQQLKDCLAPLHTPLIINDDFTLAKKIDASGVHLGQSDGNATIARQCLGPDKLIGLTVNNEHELLAANEEPVDYIGIGAIFPTKNKPNIEHIWGCEALKEATQKSRHPVIAIGGITEKNLINVLQSQVQGVAAIGAFHESNRPDKTSQFFYQSLLQETHCAHTENTT